MFFDEKNLSTLSFMAIVLNVKKTLDLSEMRLMYDALPLVL